MIRNNIKKIIIVIMCIVFLFMFVSNTILAFDEEHLLTCHDEYCEYCAMIHSAQNTINSLAKMAIMAFSSIIAIYYIFKIFDKSYFISQTLINSKVQLNE